jgi:hypothetical protein
MPAYSSCFGWRVGVLGRKDILLWGSHLSLYMGFVGIKERFPDFEKLRKDGVPSGR